MTPHSQRNHPVVQKMRRDNPYHVEVIDWMKRIAERRTNMDQLTKYFNVGASWCDHLGARTFGFKEEKDAERFTALYVNRKKKVTSELEKRLSRTGGEMDVEK